MKRTLEERFFAKVRRTRGCWIWTAARDKDGYGWFQLDGRAHKAHRISWMIHHGSDPMDMFVCHTCDNPSCVRPSHLFLGTNADNARDMVAKGRDANTQKMHCPQGHPLTGDNVINRKSGGGLWDSRYCRECGRAQSRAQYAKNRTKRIAAAVQYAKEQREANPEEFKRRQRDYMRASRARRKDHG